MFMNKSTFLLHTDGYHEWIMNQELPGDFKPLNILLVFILLFVRFV